MALKAYQKVLQDYNKYVKACMDYLEVLNNLGVQAADNEGPGTLPPFPPPPPPPPGN